MGEMFGNIEGSDHLEHLIKETKGYNPKTETAKPAETKKAPVEDEAVELVSDLYDAETKGGRLYSVGETDENLTLGLNSEDGDGIIGANTSKGGNRSYSSLYTDTDEFSEMSPTEPEKILCCILQKRLTTFPMAK